MTKVNIKTEQYQFNHGKRPSGYGWWMVEVDGEVVEFRGTVKELKKHLARIYKDKTAIEAKILP